VLTVIRLLCAESPYAHNAGTLDETMQLLANIIPHQADQIDIK
jgi:hypothetical protein